MYKKSAAVVALTFGVLGGVGVVPSGVASASPTPFSGGGADASDTVQRLQAAGYVVQVNVQGDSDLSDCQVEDIHGLAGTANEVNNAWRRIPGASTTVYVDVDCSGSNNG